MMSSIQQKPSPITKVIAITIVKNLTICFIRKNNIPTNPLLHKLYPLPNQKEPEKSNKILNFNELQLFLKSGISIAIDQSMEEVCRHR